MLTIGKLAIRTKVSTDTIRYYEKESLLKPTKKTEAGYRLYDSTAIRRLGFIWQAQQCGFSLAEIRDLLALKNDDAACCQDVRSVAIAKKLQLEYRIKALRAMSQALSDLIETCNEGSKPLQDCPILEALESSMESINSTEGSAHDG